MRRGLPEIGLNVAFLSLRFYAGLKTQIETYEMIDKNLTKKCSNQIKIVAFSGTPVACVSFKLRLLHGVVA
jgi:hypothetical protein